MFGKVIRGDFVFLHPNRGHGESVNHKTVHHIQKNLSKRSHSHSGYNFVVFSSIPNDFLTWFSVLQQFSQNNLPPQFSLIKFYDKDMLAELWKKINFQSQMQFTFKQMSFLTIFSRGIREIKWK